MNICHFIIIFLCDNSPQGKGALKAPYNLHRSNIFKVRNSSVMNRIREVLDEQGKTQIWLAEKIRKSYVVVTNYCSNNTQPSIEILIKIAKVLDVDVRELLVPTKDRNK